MLKTNRYWATEQLLIKHFPTHVIAIIANYLVLVHTRAFWVVIDVIKSNRHELHAALAILPFYISHEIIDNISLVLDLAIFYVSYPSLTLWWTFDSSNQTLRYGMVLLGNEALEAKEPKSSNKQLGTQANFRPENTNSWPFRLKFINSRVTSTTP